MDIESNEIVKLMCELSTNKGVQEPENIEDYE